MNQELKQVMRGILFRWYEEYKDESKRLRIFTEQGADISKLSEWHLEVIEVLKDENKRMEESFGVDKFYEKLCLHAINELKTRAEFSAKCAKFQSWEKLLFSKLWPTCRPKADGSYYSSLTSEKDKLLYLNLTASFISYQLVPFGCEHPIDALLYFCGCGTDGYFTQKGRSKFDSVVAELKAVKI